MKRPVLFFVINFFIGVYFFLRQSGLIPESVFSGAFNELMSIPFLITLVISTILSFRDFRAAGIRNGFFSLLAFLTGVWIISALIFLTIQTD